MSNFFLDSFETGPRSGGAGAAACYLWDYRTSRLHASTAASRTGACCHNTGFAFNSTWGIAKEFPSQLSEVWVGKAIYLRSAGTVTTKKIFSLNDGDQATVQCSLHRASGVLDLQRGGSVSLGSGSTSLALDQWWYIEWYLKVHATTGASIVRLYDLSSDITGADGYTTEINVSGVNTQATGNAWVDWFRIWANHHESGDSYVDDLYLDNAEFEGPVRNYVAAVDADGDANQWTRLSGSNNYEMVDDALTTAGDADTTYNYTNTDAQQELYGHAGFGTPAGPIRGLQAEYIDREDDAGGRSTKPILKSDGTVYNGTARACPAAYGAPHLIESWPVDPATSLAWAAAAANAAQPGAESVAA